RPADFTYFQYIDLLDAGGKYRENAFHADTIGDFSHGKGFTIASLAAALDTNTLELLNAFLVALFYSHVYVDRVACLKGRYGLLLLRRRAFFYNFDQISHHAMDFLKWTANVDKVSGFQNPERRNLVLCGRWVRQQFRPALPGPFQRLFVPPGLDSGVMSAQEHVRDLPPVVISRAGIYRRRQQVVLEGIGKGRGFVRKYARQEPYHRVGNHCGSQFPARKHVVSNADFPGNEVLSHAFIDALIMAAQDNKVCLQAPAVGHRLLEELSVRTHKNHVVVRAFRLEVVKAPVHRLDHQYHSSSSAVGIVVQGLVFSGGV